MTIVIECKKQSLESRIRAKDVKGKPETTPAFSAMANGQIKGVLAEMLDE